MVSVHLIAPSGYCINQDAAWRGVRRLEEAGITVKISMLSRDGCSVSPGGTTSVSVIYRR